MKDVFTGADGTCTLENLSAGTYAITEVDAPAGYTIDDLTDITWTRFMEIGQDVYAKTGKYLLSSEASGGDTLLMMIFSCGAGARKNHPDIRCFSISVIPFFLVFTSKSPLPTSFL